MLSIASGSGITQRVAGVDQRRWSGCCRRMRRDGRHISIDWTETWPIVDRIFNTLAYEFSGKLRIDSHASRLRRCRWRQQRRRWRRSRRKRVTGGFPGGHRIVRRMAAAVAGSATACTVVNGVPNSGVLNTHRTMLATNTGHTRAVASTSLRWFQRCDLVPLRGRDSANVHAWGFS